MWWIFLFFIVLLWKIKKYHLSIEKYLDCIVLSFFFAAIIWYIGAFFGGQIYWKPTTLPIWIVYNNSNANVPFYWDIFPLAIIYAIISFALFVLLYIQRVISKTDWTVGYLWMFIFSVLLFGLEFLNWDPDIFQSFMVLNLNQIWAIIIALTSFRWLRKIGRAKTLASLR